MLNSLPRTLFIFSLLIVSPCEMFCWGLRYLAEHVDDDNRIVATQTELANEVGTAREVISRNLQKLQGLGLIHVGRGFVEVRNREKLRSIAQL